MEGTKETVIPALGSPRGYLGVDLPIDCALVKKARDLLDGRNIKINELAEILAQDPVLSLELLSEANRRFHANERPAIANVRTALFRLGSESVISVFDELLKRKDLAIPAAMEEFVKLRTIARRISGVARFLAAIVSREVVEEAQMAGLLSMTGHMLGCACFPDVYSALSGKAQKASVIYRLSQDCNFDITKVQLSYLESRGIPQSLYFVFDREIACKTPIQAALRFIVDAAVELVDGYDAGKWAKYAPAVELPAKSALRLLRINERQHGVIFEEIGEYLAKTALTPPQNQVPAAAKVSEEPVLVEEPKPVYSEIEYIEAGEAVSVEPPKHFSESSQRVVRFLRELFTSATSSEDLLKKILALLIAQGPFHRAALLIVLNNRRSAHVHVAVGKGFSKLSLVTVKDELSPIAMCSTKIKSFNCRVAVDLAAPFGVTAYALSPIRIKNAQPVLLYADCGSEHSLPFEARRIFRLVVGLLNATLPKLPGGLPVFDEQDILDAAADTEDVEVVAA